MITVIITRKDFKDGIGRGDDMTVIAVQIVQTSIERRATEVRQSGVWQKPCITSPAFHECSRMLCSLIQAYCKAPTHFLLFLLLFPIHTLSF